MQSRKLQQVGGGTYTVSIPKDWADEHRLRAGMELHLYTHTDGSIVLRPSEKDGAELGTAQVAIDGRDPALVERALVTAHAVGFETVTLVPSEAFTGDQRRAARDAVRNLVGADLLVERQDEIVVQHLLDAANVSVRQSVIQLQYTALSVHRQATVAVLDGDAEAAERLEDRRNEADRLARMVTRHFSRSLVSFDEVDRLNVSRPTLFDCYRTARALERVTHDGLGLARVAATGEPDVPEPLAAEVRTAAEAVRTVLEDATAAVLDGTTVADAQAILDRQRQAVESVDAIERAAFDEPPDSLTAESVAGTTRLLDRLRRTAETSGAIGRSALRAAARESNVGSESD